MFLRTKWDQQICGLPDKVAGRVDKAANHSHDFAKWLGSILFVGWCWIPIMPVDCQVSLMSLKQLIVALNCDILKTAAD